MMNKKVLLSFTFIIMGITIAILVKYSVKIINHQFINTHINSLLSTRVTKGKESAQNQVTQQIFSADDLLGSWKYSLADKDDPLCKHASTDTVCFPNDSEEINFNIESGQNIFNSYIHDRPEDTGCNWKVQKNEITIHCPNSDSSLDKKFIVTSLDKKLLTIYLENEGPLDAITYTSYKP